MMLKVVNAKQHSKGMQYVNQKIENKLKENQDRQDIYVLMENDQVIGYCELCIEENIPWIQSLYIDEVYRGHNYGQLLMNHVLHRAKLLGYEFIYLRAKKTDYYRHQGWSELKEAQVLDSNIYFKSLNEER